VSVRAIVFDFNGTLSDDEPVLCDVWREIFGELDAPLGEEEYYDRLAGLADTEIAETWLGPDHPRLGWAMEERGRRYRERAADGSTVSGAMREAVRLAAARVPVAVVSGAPGEDIREVLAAAGLDIPVVVASEDVTRGKPDPEGFRLALERLGEGIAPADVMVFEDSEPGVAAAKAAGMRCIAVRGTIPAERLARADSIVETVTPDLVRRILDEP
jgi:beta-phosphoglucomutase